MGFNQKCAKMYEKAKGILKLAPFFFLYVMAVFGIFCTINVIVSHKIPFASYDKPCVIVVNNPEVERAEKIVSVMQKHVKPYISRPIIETIVSEALKYKYGLLYLSIITVQSNFDVFARPKAGAIGCGQIKYDAWKDELQKVNINSRKNTFDPRKYVHVLHHVYTCCLDKAKGNHVKALKLYVCGNTKNSACSDFVTKVLTVYSLYALQLKENTFK